MRKEGCGFSYLWGGALEESAPGSPATTSRPCPRLYSQGTLLDTRVTLTPEHRTPCLEQKSRWRVPLRLFLIGAEVQVQVALRIRASKRPGPQGDPDEWQRGV